MDVVLIFLGGLLGSAHCVGMCGPIVIMVTAGTKTHHQALRRQALFTCGRVTTYGILGALAGGVGWRVGQSVPPWVNVSALLAVLAGALLVFEGIAALGWMPLRQGHFRLPCLSMEIIRQALAQRQTLSVFLAGAGTGLLPCGLLYGFLALSGSSTNVLQGGVIMITFGLGTVPALMLLGMGGRVLGGAARARILRVAAICVIATGVISLGRGFGFWNIGAAKTEAKCPFCIGE